MTSRAVVDTNVLVSGLGWGGPPAAVVDAAMRRRIQPVTSQELLDELRRVLAYPRLSSVLRTAGLTAAELVALVADASVVVVPLRAAIRARDTDDARVLEAAAAGSVDVIISGTRTCYRCASSTACRSSAPRIPSLGCSRKPDQRRTVGLTVRREAVCAQRESGAVVSDWPAQMRVL